LRQGGRHWRLSSIDAYKVETMLEEKDGPYINTALYVPKLGNVTFSTYRDLRIAQNIVIGISNFYFNQFPNMANI
jgi:hypothetical protein